VEFFNKFLKALLIFAGIIGTTEVVPFQNVDVCEDSSDCYLPVFEDLGADSHAVCSSVEQVFFSNMQARSFS
jgi:hypothetical protein